MMTDEEIVQTVMDDVEEESSNSQEFLEFS